MQEVQQSDVKPTRQKMMKRGRCCVTLFNWLFLATIIVLCGVVMEPEQFGAPDWGPLATTVGISYPCLFGILFVLLSWTVFTLIKKLKIKNDEIISVKESDQSGSENVFEKEICTLTIILIIFSITYLLRVIFDVIAVM